MAEAVKPDEPQTWPRRYQNLETGLVRTFWREPRHGHWRLIFVFRRPAPEGEAHG